MGGANKRLIRSCAGAFGRERKESFVRALKPSLFEYSKEAEEKIRGMLLVSMDGARPPHHEKLVAMIKKNPLKLDYFLNIYFSGDKLVSERASDVIFQALYGLSGDGSISRTRTEHSNLLVELRLASGDLAESELESCYGPSGNQGLDEKLASFYLANKVPYKLGDSLDNNPAGFAVEDAVWKIISQLRSGDIERVKRAVELADLLPLTEGLVSDSCVLELLAQIKSIKDLVSSGVKEKIRRISKTPIYRDDDATIGALGNLDHVEEDLSQLVSHLKYVYEERTGVEPVVPSAQKKLQFKAQKLLVERFKKG